MPTHKRPEAGWRKYTRLIPSIAAACATILALVFAAIPIFQSWHSEQVSRRQFEESGPAYSCFPLTGVAPNLNSDGHTIYSTPAYAIVLTNTGRTNDSVIDIQQKVGSKTQEMRMCVPNFNKDGVLDESEPVKPDSASIRITAGDARLMVLVGDTSSATLNPDTGTSLRGKPFTVTDYLIVYTASGRNITAQRDADVSQRTVEHYDAYVGLDKAVSMCAAHVAGRR